MKDDYTTYPLSKNLIYNQQTFELNVQYQILSNAKVCFGYANQMHAGDIQYIPSMIYGNSNTLLFGLNVGF